MSNKNTVFYRKNTAVMVDFSADQISSDGAVVLLDKIEHEHKVIKYLIEVRQEIASKNKGCYAGNEA